VPTNHSRLWRATAVLTVVVVVLGIACYAAYHELERLTATPPPPPGCSAGPTAQVITLDTDQAVIASTIAGVAARHHLSQRALTVAYATALQESDMEDLDYGDRDSVGVFQQRPSQGWGTTAEIENPVYATTRFFAALVKVPHYATIPVDQAAQDVQRSADGSAYQQYAYVAGLLAGYFTGLPTREVSCWYTPPANEKADLATAKQGLAQTFGPTGRKAVLAGVSTERSDKIIVAAQRGEAWTVAIWLVTHAQQYQISEVQYSGYEWEAADGSMGWQRDSAPAGAARGTIVAG
jgi:hypothetical protein